ncbi:MAG: hypothetical protein DMG43_12535 [Acidobacteria bacterium]|nr:MAG: hypothetical protein DMG43_12535 [Acidobacteriota bacterium]
MQIISLPYDILRKDDGGEFTPVEAAKDLKSAKVRMIELSAHSPGQYVVVSQTTGKIAGSVTTVSSCPPRADQSDHKEPWDAPEEVMAHPVGGFDTFWR